MDWTDQWLWISAVLGIAGGVVMFVPFARVLRWRARILERMETAPNRTALSIWMEAGTFGWVVAGAIVFLFLPTLLLPHGIVYLAAFMLAMAYKRPRFNRRMEAMGIAPHATRRRPGA
ncbi:MAG TPA: hypothetical protein VFB33_08470 [Candidatus Binataceae bacterium]|nr:hypothetical protein [Candidatus Binataceae bacterium]